MSDADAAGVPTPPTARLRVEVWREGAWRPSSLLDAQVGETVRMLEPDGALSCPEAPFLRVAAPARPVEPEHLLDDGLPLLIVEGDVVGDPAVSA